MREVAPRFAGSLLCLIYLAAVPTWSMEEVKEEQKEENEKEEKYQQELNNQPEKPNIKADNNGIFFPTKEQMNLQGEINELCDNVLKFMNQNPQKALASLQKIKKRKIDFSKIYDHLTPLTTLALGLTKGHSNNYIKIEMAEIMHDFSDLAYLQNKTDNTSLDEKEREEALSKIDNFVEGLERILGNNTVSNNMKYHLLNIKTCIYSLRYEKPFYDQVRGISSKIFDDITNISIGGSVLGLSGQYGPFAAAIKDMTCGNLMRIFKEISHIAKEKSYVEVMQIRLLAKLAAVSGDKEYLVQLQQQLAELIGKRIGEKRYLLVHAIIDGFYYIASDGKNDDVAEQAVKELGKLTTLNLKGTKKNRVRMKLAHALVLLSSSENKKIQNKANELLKVMEKSNEKKVKIVLGNKKSILKMQKLLKTNWGEKNKSSNSIMKIIKEIETNVKRINDKIKEMEVKEKSKDNADEITYKINKMISKDTFKKEINDLKENWLEKIRAVSEHQWEQMRANGLFHGIEKLYVAPKAKLNREAEPTMDLRQEVDKFLAGNDKVFLILSDRGGQGKSVFMQLLERRLWKGLAKKQSLWTPIYIPLNTVEDPSRLIEEVLKSENRIGIKDPSSLKPKENILFLFDGFDEIDKKKWQNLYQKNGLGAWRNSKVIITSRDEALPSDYAAQFFAPHKNNLKGLRSVYIADFDQGQIEQYIKNYVNLYETDWSFKEYMKWIQETPALSFESTAGLSRVPIFMRLICESLPRIVQTVQKNGQDQEMDKVDVTSYRLFETFMQMWFEREYDKHSKDAAHVLGNKQKAVKRYWRYAMMLARKMTQDDKIAFVHKPAAKSDKVKVEKDPLDSDNDDDEDEKEMSYWDEVFPKSQGYTNVVKDMMFRAIPLCTDRGRDHTYRFWHKKMQDFFDAKMEKGFLQKSPSPPPTNKE